MGPRRCDLQEGDWPMNAKLISISGAVILALAGGSLWLFDGEDVYLGDARIAIIDGPCPVVADVAEAEDGQTAPVCDWSKEDGGRCICATKIKDGLPDECKNLADCPTSKPQKLVVCPGGKVSYLATSAIDTEGCKKIDIPYNPNEINLQVGGALESALTKACAPCIITPNSWGPCPYCLLDNSCEKACTPKKEIETVEGTDSL